MRRREFLKWQLSGALWLAAGAPFIDPRPALAATPDIAVATGEARAATHAAVKMLGGMKRFVAPGQRVLIKPNMSFATEADYGANTHPEVVAALAEMCRDAGASSILVMDNPLSQPEECMVRSGIREACRDIGRDIVQAPTASRFFREEDIPGALSMGANAFLREALEADVIIAAPTAKSHGSTGVSLGLKGMMGLISNRGVMHWRYDLDTAIVDLNTKLRAALTVVDGIYVLTTGGPYGPGKVVKADTVIASADIVAADAYAVEAFEWYGRSFEARQVKHLRLAHERGLGRMDVAALNVQRIAL
ncbi:protein of unknown function DUF362 [Alkalidesulfovibrio alkalitolerans DSM 16529]|jgi:uncharacterized protein (DUF362 family)|uniref:DUF362 domain-containing protein n=1 Tax=Alkalidesulfovibrio alkalitolerans DSM 16529 TaxID=1121439 RepID=S7TDN1_9BACT|nr:DUF362 domain-containing protein [Alkalidesulfovibrio alkalitolerans]EPR34756.1 protein of unknown function DUF362 [Alkalidesulfovibrio alkalitolerans DSM 16529]